MWPFSKAKARPKGRLTDDQAKAVTRIFYRDHEVTCWYACARLSAGDDVRIAAASKAEAIALADVLAREVLQKSGRILLAQNGT